MKIELTISKETCKVVANALDIEIEESENDSIIMDLIDLQKVLRDAIDKEKER